MTKLRWKGQLNGQQYTLGNTWEAWRDVKNDDSVIVVFISGSTILKTVASSKAESSRWVHRQIQFIQSQVEIHNRPCEISDELQMNWGRNRIPVKYVLHPLAAETQMESVIKTLRQCADSLQAIDLGVVKYVAYNDAYQPMFLVGQKGKTYLMPLSPYASANAMRAAVRRYHVEGMKRVERPN